VAIRSSRESGGSWMTGWPATRDSAIAGLAPPAHGWPLLLASLLVAAALLLNGASSPPHPSKSRCLSPPAAGTWCAARRAGPA